MTTKNNLKFKANSFRVWRYCQEHNWNVSRYDISLELGISIDAIAYIIAKNNWGGKIRKANIEGGKTKEITEKALLSRKLYIPDDYDSKVDLVNIFHDEHLGMKEYRKMYG